MNISMDCDTSLDAEMTKETNFEEKIQIQGQIESHDQVMSSSAPWEGFRDPTVERA